MLGCQPIELPFDVPGMLLAGIDSQAHLPNISRSRWGGGRGGRGSEVGQWDRIGCKIAGGLADHRALTAKEQQGSTDISHSSYFDA
jgi:hypothetical protein